MSNFFKASSLALFLALLSPLAATAQTQVCGTVYLELYDSYGDGWNGNEIDVKFTGGDSTYTLSSGSFISIPLSVNYLDTAEFVWQNGGSYTSECTYKVTDAAGTVLYSSPTGNNMTIGSTQYTAYCATPPVPQMCGTVYLELYDSYGDGWNGNEIDVSFTGGDSTFTMSSGSFVSYALTIPYQDTAHFIWQNGGSYTSECTYKVTDAYGTVLYSSPTGNNMTIGATQYSLQCNSLASCIAPTNLSVTTGSTDAALSFDGTSSYAYHLVEYDTAGFAPGTGDTMWVYADTAYITGLMPATSYDFYVTTLCSASDSSAATASLGQFTQCAALATPYSENFDAATTGSAFNPSLPQCWDFYTNTTSSFYYPYVYNRNYSFYANSGSNFLYAYRSSSSSTSPSYADTTMAIMPEIQGLDSATKQLKFYARTTSVGRPGEVIIGLTDAAGTPSSLKIVDTVYAPTTTYSQYTVYLDGATTGDARVALVFMRQIGTYDYVCIDDVEISDIPPCPEPIGLSLASATRTSATINWSSSSAAFDIEVGPMGFTQGTGTSYTSTTNSVTATNLMQNTYYDAYVRSNCSSSGNGYSSFVGPFTFKTECGWFSSPYVQDFGYSDGTGSSSNPDLPDCWSHENLSAYIYNYCYVDKYYYYGNQATDSAYIYLSTYYSQYNSQTALGDTNAVILPMMTDLSNNDQQILFNARSSSTSAAYNAKMAIGTVDSTGDLSTLVIMDTVEFTSTTYADYTLDLDNVPTNAASIAIVAFGMANPGYTYGYNRAYIDRVEIRQAPQCPEVYDVVATATSDTSGTMSWGDSSVVDEYLIDWGLAGFTQGTGVYDTIVGTSWSNNTLIPGETYDFYFQSVCNSQGINSPWYGPVTLEVPCAPTSVPFADGFENKPTSYGNSSNPNLPDCWTYSMNDNPGNSYSYGSTSTWSSYSGSGYLYNRQSNVAGDTVVVSLPMIENLDTDGAVLKFWARVSSTFYQGQMAVATSGVTGDYKTAAVAQNMNVTNNTYQQFSVYLDSNVVPAGAQRPAFLFYSISGSYNYIYLDSVEVEALPSCIAYNFEESNMTSSSVDLSWSYTGNNSFNIEYGPTGFIQGTGIGSTISGLSVPYTLSNLNQNTTYDYYVENTCNPGTWYGPYTFTTECAGPLTGGVYTVGSNGTFKTLDSAITVLNNCGITSAVTFEFQAGTYTASQYIGEINGSSASNTITFKGGSGADTIAVGTDAAFVLEGAKYMNFEDLYIYAPSGKGFRLNGASDIVIDGNVIEAGTTTSSTVNGIVSASSATSVFSTTTGEKNITITNNQISGGYYGIRLYGSSSGRNENINISNNVLDGAYYYGIYVYYGTDVTISENTMGNFGSNFGYGIYPYQIDGLKATLNHVTGVNYGLWAYYPSTTSAATISSEISNNMLQANNYGLAVYYGDSVGVYHNTAVGAYGLRDYYNDDNVDIRNNIIVGSTYALYNYNTDAFQDYNLYYGSGSGFAYVYDGTFSYPDSLASLQALDSLNNMNSSEGDPIFVSATDLHATGILPHNNGDSLVPVNIDFDGETRPSGFNPKPDIGADEYEIFTNLNYTIVLDTTLCLGDSLTLSTAYTTATSVIWSNGESGQSITIPASSDSVAYTVQTVSDSVRLEQFIIRAHELPDAYLSSSGTIYKCPEDSLDVSAFGTNGSYMWSNDETSSSITLGVSGDYWFTVTDSNSCSSVSDTLHLTDYTLISSELTWSNPDTAAGAPITLLNNDTIQVCYGGNVGLKTNSSAVSTNWNTGDSTSLISVINSGLYFASTITSNGCEVNSDTIYVEVQTQLPDSILTASVINRCVGESAVLAVDSGLNLSYSWNTGEIGNQIMVSSNGTYYATVMNTFGCSITTDTVSFVNYNLPNDSIWALSATAFCNQDSVQLQVSSNSLYSWSTGDSSQQVTIGTGGAYWAEVTDTNGCSAFTDTIDLTVYSLPNEVITVSGLTEFCDGDSASLSLSGQNNYQWTNSDSSSQITVFTSGNYFATLTDSNGCQNSSDTVSVVVNALPSDSLVITGNTEFCDGDSVLLGALTNSSYAWSTGDTTQQITISTTSTVTGLVVDANGCSRQLDTAHIMVNPLPNDSIFASGATTFCLGDSVTIHSTDLNANHLWSNLDTSESILVTSAGSYYVGLVSDKGCIAGSDTIDVVVNPNPNPNVTATGSLDLCPGDSVTLSGNSGFTYAWSTGDSTQSITLGQTASVSLDVTNAFGCTSTSTVQDIILHAFPTTSQILGDTTGIVPLQQYQYVVSQTPGNTYQWSAVNGAIVSGQGTNIASVMWSQDTIGSLSVVESNGYCTDTAHLAIRTHIGLEELLADQLMIYPNPSQGQVTLESTLSLSRISLYTTTGELVNVIETDESTFTFDLSDYPNGVYWISVYGRQYKVVIID